LSFRPMEKLLEDYRELSASHLDFYHKQVKTIRRNLMMETVGRIASEDLRAQVLQYDATSCRASHSNLSATIAVISLRISPFLAPSAIRTPISCVRRETA